ncbi:MAG TPA: ATP-dependent DNA helicase RecG [Patescibacteria group bacterium]|nr:ATP-dependent DNA helicase RecG [Patescibacteria group bacterium]
MDLRTVKVDELPLVGPQYAKKLEKLGIYNLWDLMHHVPFRFLDFSKSSAIYNLQIGETATIKGTVTSFVNQYTKKGKPMQIVTIADDTGKVNAIWFNQIYLARTFKKGTKVAIAGELNFMGRNKAIVAPEYEILNEEGNQIHTGGLIPIYSETAGISSKWLRRRIHDVWEKYENDLQEFLPQNVLEKYNLIDFKIAVANVHFPKSLEEFEKGKNRLAFNELLSLHSVNMARKKEWEENKIKKVLKINKNEINKFIKNLPFKLTTSQQTVIDEILDDLQKNIPMNRLLEGDVGSGKTVVAAIGIYATYLNKRKSVLMAPTQILANQHFNTLKSLFKNTEIKVGLWTGSEKTAEEFDVLIGTHALLNAKNKMRSVSFIVIDEQHKFGVKQREKLNNKSTSTKVAHILTMTATPIPRTVALTFFGDLSLSVLNELPKGRQKIVTWVVPKNKRGSGFKWIKTQIKNENIQAFVVCPLIDESENLIEVSKARPFGIKAANKEYEYLQKMFPDLRIGLLHGRMKNREKDEAINDFKAGKINILVATPVVEVGIDIPNATIMVIEAADRFGLASLHQLRGRVGRGQLKSYCLLMSENESEKSGIRLNAMTKTSSGFELAELDLALRGPGEIYGNKQSGIPELKIADWNNLQMIKDAREVAELTQSRL